MSSFDTRLAVYGTLAPGKPHHHELDALRSQWEDGAVRGRLIRGGWAAEDGYPAPVLGSDGQEVAVRVFTSPDLSTYWARLDAFEGGGYQRVSASIVIGDRAAEAWIYAAAD